MDERWSQADPRVDFNLKTTPDNASTDPTWPMSSIHQPFLGLNSQTSVAFSSQHFVENLLAVERLTIWR